MPRIRLKKDTLDRLNGDYEQTPLEAPVFLNSVPKSGTHLIKNIFRMFVPLEQHYSDAFVQMPRFEKHEAAFDLNHPRLAWGHLVFTDAAAITLSDTRQIVLARDPHSWVLARTRFFLSKNYQGNVDGIKDGGASIPEVMNMMIYGVPGKVPAMRTVYQDNCLAWMGTGVRLVRFEDLLHNIKHIKSAEAELYFREMFEHCGMVLPPDWRGRIAVGSDRAQSGTSRENLRNPTGDIVPDELPEVQKALVDLALPGLRAFLGYS